MVNYRLGVAVPLTVQDRYYLPKFGLFANLHSYSQRLTRFIRYVLSTVYFVYFCLLLLFFHGWQHLAFRFGGRPAQKRVSDWMNALIMHGWVLTGSGHRFRVLGTLPTDKPLIFVANHQSMFDISPIAWYLRRHNPVFVSKVELGRGTPAVSYNLRQSGAALVDRNDPRQTLTELSRLGQRLQEGGCSVVIFPEGTRSRDGKPKPFVTGGLAMLLRKCPTALVVPVAIAGTGHFNPEGLFPLRPFSRMSWTVLPPLIPLGKSAEAIIRQAESLIMTCLATQKTA